jgi:inner membrane protein
MPEFFANLGYWHWLAFGVLLGVIEMLAPGAALLWVGTAALVTGGIVWLLPGLDWQWQVFIFGLLAMLAVIFSRRYLKIRRGKSADPLLNNRYERLVGQVLTLESPIINGHGRVRVDDGSFLVSGPNLPLGHQVRIIAVDGAVLRVEAVV